MSENRIPFLVQWFAAVVLGVVLGVLGLLLVWSKPAAATDNCVENPSPTKVAEEGVVPEVDSWGPLWVTADKVRLLPKNGISWDRLEAVARGDWGLADLGGNNNNHDVNTYAGALVAVATDDDELRDRVEDGLRLIVRCDCFERGLPQYRNIPAYLEAAEVLELRTTNKRLHEEVDAWALEMLHKQLKGHSGGTDIVSTHERSRNNWGAAAGAARVAIAVYRRDRVELEAAWYTFQQFVDQAVEDDGSLPEELRREHARMYSWEAMQHMIVAAQLLANQGYESYAAGNQAILRAVQFLDDRDWPATGDDLPLIWLLRSVYGSQIDQEPSEYAMHGKNNGWMAWTEQGVSGGY